MLLCEGPCEEDASLCLPPYHNGRTRKLLIYYTPREADFFLQLAYNDTVTELTSFLYSSENSRRR